MQFYGKDYKYLDCRAGDFLMRENVGTVGEIDSGRVSIEKNKSNTIFSDRGFDLGQKIRELREVRRDEPRRINIEKNKAPTYIEENNNFKERGVGFDGSGGQGNMEFIDSCRNVDGGFGNSEECGPN